MHRKQAGMSCAQPQAEAVSLEFSAKLDTILSMVDEIYIFFFQFRSPLKDHLPLKFP